MFSSLPLCVVWALVGGWSSPPRRVRTPVRAHPARLCAMACPPAFVCIRMRTRKVNMPTLWHCCVFRSHSTDEGYKFSLARVYAKIKPQPQLCLPAPVLPACCSVLLCIGLCALGGGGLGWGGELCGVFLRDPTGLSRRIIGRSAEQQLCAQHHSSHCRCALRVENRIYNPSHFTPIHRLSAA